jgi:hypothetical protein
MQELAGRWNETYDAVQHWAHLFGYDKAPYRRGLPREVWARVDWDQPLIHENGSRGATKSTGFRIGSNSRPHVAMLPVCD